MTAPNHALTGAVIGLTVTNPLLALPLALVSHLVCDAIPHYDPPETNKATVFTSMQFVRDFLVIGAGLCLLIVLLLAYARPQHWLTAAVCAFLATSPDLLWIPRFLRARRTGKDVLPSGWFFWLHDRIQWLTGPKLIWVEAAWFVVFSALLISKL